jgi:DNA-binding MarR family transcriptional regulator
MTDDVLSPAAALLRGILALGRRARAERPSGSLSLSGLGILGSLNRVGPLFATQLAAEERLKPQSLTRLLAELEEQGLITRIPSDRDRRALTISITTLGRGALVEDMRARRAWLESAMEQVLSVRERKTVIAASALMLRLAAAAPADFQAGPT